MSFMTLAFAQVFHAFNARSRWQSIFKRHLFANRWLWLAVGGCLALQLAAVYVPLLQRILRTTPPDAADWAVIMGCLLAPIVVIELIKLVTRALRASTGSAPQRARLSDRPLSSSLVAIGRASPIPAAPSRADGIPRRTRSATTACARRCDNARLYASVPSLDVCPSRTTAVLASLRRPSYNMASAGAASGLRTAESKPKVMPRMDGAAAQRGWRRDGATRGGVRAGAAGVEPEWRPVGGSHAAQQCVLNHRQHEQALHPRS